MKKICFVSGDIGHSGGTERVCILIANELARRGYDISILSFWHGDSPFFEVHPNVKVFYLINGRYEAWLKKTFIYAVLKLRKFIIDNSIDILIDVDTVLSRYSVYAVQNTSCQLISWEHFNYEHTISEKIRIKTLKKIKKNSGKVLLLTKADYIMHRDLANIDESRLYQIYNPTSFSINETVGERKKIFLAIGRLTYQKGFDTLLQIWNEVWRHLPEWKLQIVGSGEDEEFLRQYIYEHALKNIELIPNTTEIEKFYLDAAIYLMTSRFEGFPMVLLEAKAKGLPIISFDCKTGPNEIISDGESGFVVNMNDIPMFTNKMITLANNEELRLQFANKSLKEIKNFTVQSIVDEWEKMLSEV